MSNIDKSIYIEIGDRLSEISPERHLSSHEWEEMVQKLCASDDAGLRNVDVKELYDLLNKRPPNVGK